MWSVRDSREPSEAAPIATLHTLTHTPHTPILTVVYARGRHIYISAVRKMS